MLCLNSFFLSEINALSTHKNQIFPLFWKFTTVVVDLHQGWPEGSLFNSYHTEESGSVLLHSLNGSTLPLILTFIMPSVKQGVIKYHFFESLVWLDLGLNPSLPDHWWTLYSLGQWAGKTVICKLMIQLGSNFDTCHLKVSTL